MNNFFYDLAPDTITIIICSFFVLFTWSGILLIRPILRIFLRGEPRLNHVLGTFLSMFGIFYGILLGLLAVASYQNKVAVDRLIVQEATQINTIMRVASTFSDNRGKEIKDDLIEYTRFVIDEEWPVMRTGKIAPGGGVKVKKLMEDLVKIKLLTPAEKNLHATAIDAVSKFLEFRVQRLYSAKSGIPGVMWFVVLFGAFLNIILILLFDMKIMTQILLGGILSFFIGTVVSLIMILDHPLQGAHGIEPTPFQLLHKIYTKNMNNSGGKLPSGTK